MHDNLDEMLKKARVDMPEKAHDRIDNLLSDLPSPSRKKQVSRPILTAIAAALLIFVIITVATPVGRATATHIIEWFYNAVFVHGDGAVTNESLPEEGSRTYKNADELISDINVEVLVSDCDNPLDVTFEDSMMSIVSLYGDIRVYQHVTYDGKSYEHRVYSDGKDKDEPYSIKIGDLELAGFVSDKGCYLVGTLHGVWFEVNTDSASKADFIEFTKTLCLRGGGR